MKSPSEKEMDSLLCEMQGLVGSTLEAVHYNEKALQLKFVDKSEIVWFCFSFKPGPAYFFSTSERLYFVPSLKKPLPLFIKTHFVGRQLQGFSRDKKKGRVLELDFGDLFRIEMNLIPGFINISAQVDQKKVYAHKPKLELPEKKTSSSFQEVKTLRNSKDFHLFWQEQQKVRKPNDAQVQFDKDLKKKRKGLLKMQESLEQLRVGKWEEVGDWLKNQETLSVPHEFQKWIDPDQSLSENIQNCFQRAKKNQRKIEGTLERIQSLELEISNLEKQGPPKKNKSQTLVRKSLLAEAQLQGRTVELESARLFIGRHGKDNLQLLRKAKAWYLWMHIKDFPGAHGIVDKKRGASLSGKELNKAATELVKLSVNKWQNLSFEVIYTECRYVRPIKGAKSGQVTYSHEKVIRVRLGND